MKLIISAMKDELNEIIIKLDNIIKLNDSLFEIYRYKNFLFAISGIGTFNANICLTYLLNKFPEISLIYNFGVVGSMSDKIKPLDVVFVKKSLWFLENKIANCKPLKLDSTRITYEEILTSDFFLQKNTLKKLIENFYKNHYLFNQISNIKIIDMEYSAFLFVALKYKKDIYGIKVVSDSALHRSNEKEYEKNMVYCKRILKQIFFQLLIK